MGPEGASLGCKYVSGFACCTSRETVGARCLPALSQPPPWKLSRSAEGKAAGVAPARDCFPLPLSQKPDPGSGVDLKSADAQGCEDGLGGSAVEGICRNQRREPSLSETCRVDAFGDKFWACLKFCWGSPDLILRH